MGYNLKFKNKYQSISPALKAGFWFTVCNILQRGIQFLTTPIYTRLLSTEEYGMYSVFTTWLNILTVFATLNLSSGPYYNGMLKYEKDSEGYTSSVQSLGSLLTLSFACLFSIVYPIIGSFIGLPYKVSILMFIVTFANPAFLFWSVQQRLNYKYRALILATVINSLLAPVIGILLVAKYEMNYVGIVLGYVTGNALVCSIFYIKNIFKGRKFYSKEYWNYSLKLSVPLIPHYLSQMVLGQSDRIMIKYFCGADDAGIYSLAYQVSLIMNLLISGINNSLTPWMYRHLKEREYKKIKKATTQLIILIAILSGMAMLVAPEIVGVLGTKEYMQAVWIIPSIMFSTCVTFVYCIWGTVLFFFEKTKKVALATSSGAVLNVILNVLLIPKFGFIAAAYTTLLGYIVICWFYWNFTRQVYVDKKVIFNELFDMKAIKITLCGLFTVSMLVLMVYRLNIVIRYSLLFLVLIFVLIERKKIIGIVKSIKEK